ncbi:Calcitonin receptor [Merluccius polli]|uniref:Calcitonin gene-related peptide type 1 receptor n=1 Tax=Merluccius polli TaxID=89951 RepID=A0AA47NYB4_MERPO|nr:Calcitonin receptor [Merluccius polli]
MYSTKWERGFFTVAVRAKVAVRQLSKPFFQSVKSRQQNPAALVQICLCSGSARFTRTTPEGPLTGSELLAVNDPASNDLSILDRDPFFWKEATMNFTGSLWVLMLLVGQSRASASDDPAPDSSPGPGWRNVVEGQGRAESQGQQQCLQSANEEGPPKPSGVYCSSMWDSMLCWEESPAGTYLTKNCPASTDTDLTGKATKYCDRWGNWVHSPSINNGGSNCQPISKDKLKEPANQMLSDEATEPIAELTLSPAADPEQVIQEAKYKCFEKMEQDPPNDKPGAYCGRNWDGWLCWDDTPAGTNSTHTCPGYFRTSDPAENATRYCGEDGQWFRQTENKRFWSDYTRCTSQVPLPVDEYRPPNEMVVDADYACFKKMKQDPPYNKPGAYCGRTWDGWLCWDDTPAGTRSSQLCPAYFADFNTSEMATKDCGEDGLWFKHPQINRTWSNYSLCVIKPTRQQSEAVEPESTTDPKVGLFADTVENERTRKMILDSQYKCFEKMNRDPAYNKTGPFCSRNWDGWLCWDDSPARTFSAQNCPSYFKDFDPTEKATKYCEEKGQWFRHPDTNRTWSNYTNCNANTKEKLKSAFILYYMAIVGHALSIASLLISLSIFFYFRSLSCQRITLHKNLFWSYVLNSTITLFYLITVVNNPGIVSQNPVGCKVLHFFHMYMLGCNYFWMLCEGIYLHTLIVVAVFAEEQHLHWYYLLGWGFPLVPASIHAVARKQYFDDNCWMSVDTHLLYVVHGPIMAALLVNLFFLLNIVRVLVTKLRDTHRAESNMYMKAVRATLILVPLLGIQFVIFPWRPENRLAGEVYDYFMHIIMHYQGLLVATIFCFFNGEVQGTLKRQWMQYKTQWGQRKRDHCSMRSTSYTATSISEVPTFMYHHECNSEHLNGHHSEDSELVALKAGETYA